MFHLTCCSYLRIPSNGTVQWCICLAWTYFWGFWHTVTLTDKLHMLQRDGKVGSTPDMICEAPGSSTGSKVSYSDWIFLWFSSAPTGKTQVICQIRSQKLYSVMFTKIQHNALHCTCIFWLLYFNYVFRLVTIPSSGGHFCYTSRVWSNVQDYFTILTLLLLLVRICRQG